MTGTVAPAVRQAFAIVEAVASQGAPMRLRDLVEATGLVKSTTYRITTTLVELDVLAVEDGAYGLGPRLVRYGAEALLDDKEIA